jgi:hypothetical protein
MDISVMQRRLHAYPNLEEVVIESGVSRKTIQRLKSGTLGTARNYQLVWEALDRLEKRNKRAKADHRKVDVGVIDTGMGVEPGRRAGE